MSSYIYVFIIKDKYKLAYYWDGCTFSLPVKIKSVIFDTAGKFFQVWLMFPFLRETTLSKSIVGEGRIFGSFLSNQNLLDDYFVWLYLLTSTGMRYKQGVEIYFRENSHTHKNKR